MTTLAMHRPAPLTRKIDLGCLMVHATLIAYTVLALFPIALILINSVKSRAAIFDDPLALPTMESLTFVGFQKVLASTNFLLYFGNSLYVTLVALLCIVLFGAMAAWALSEYSFM